MKKIISCQRSLILQASYKDNIYLRDKNNHPGLAQAKCYVVLFQNDRSWLKKSKYLDKKEENEQAKIMIRKWSHDYKDLLKEILKFKRVNDCYSRVWNRTVASQRQHGIVALTLVIKPFINAVFIPKSCLQTKLESQYNESNKSPLLTQQGVCTHEMYRSWKKE